MPWFLVRVLALTPLVFFWRSSSPFLLTKAVFVHVVGSLACLSLALARHRPTPDAEGPTQGQTAPPRTLLFAGLFVGYAAFRAPWFASVRPEIAAPFLWGTLLVVAWPTVVSLQAMPGALSRYARLLVCVGGATAAYALLQAAGIDLPLYRSGHRILSGTFSTGAGQPPFSTLGNPNFLGEHLTAFLPLAVALALAGDRGARWLPWAATALMAGALPLTLARGPWLGAVAGLAATLLLLPAPRRNGRRLLRAGLFVAAPVLVATTAVGLWGGGATPWHKAIGTISQIARAGEGRRLWWGATLPMIHDHIWAGVGEGRFREAYPPYQARFLAGLPDSEGLAVPAAPVESPHNDYLHVAADLGLPGLLLLAATLAGIVWHGVRQAQGEEGPVRSVRAGGVGGITALLVAALVGYPMHTASGLCALAGLAALAVAEPGGRDGTGLPPSWAARLLAAAGVIALLHTARLLIVFAASMHLHSGEEALLNRDLPEAALHLERAYEVWPRDSAVRAALGRAYLGAGRPDLALPFLEAGLRGHDSARTRTLLGRTYMTLGRTEAAAETFRVGEAAFPGYAPFHATYGAFLASQGQFPEAGRELERALALDQKLGDAYYWLGNVREREGDAAGAARALRRFLATAAADDPRRGPAAGQLAALEGPPSRVDNRTEPVR